jgi:Uma2 family endonuclease
MTGASVLAVHPGPYTLLDLEAMPEDGQRYELIDGGLHVTPAPTPLHQVAAGRLRTLLVSVAPPEWEAVEAVDVQCGKDTVLQPDVVALRAAAVFGSDRVVDAADVALVVEIVSPSSARMDRVLKPQLYADAGIPTYLLVDLKEPIVTWFGRSDAGGYTILGSATGTEPLRLTEPFEVEIVPADLVRRRG